MDQVRVVTDCGAVVRVDRPPRPVSEPLVKNVAPADKWAYYEKEIRPYVLPFDAIVSGSRVDGDLDRLTQVVTVTQSGN